MIVETLGDPHLGKQFVRNVPLHRRGEREESQWRDFEASLNKPCDIHVCMGDLFDQAFVPYAVVLKAAHAYGTAARRNYDTKFVVIRGNHDASRDRDFVSAYTVFANLMGGIHNVFVLEDEPLDIDGHLFVPWHPFRTAAEVISNIERPVVGRNHTTGQFVTEKFEAVYGHWDVIDFGNDNPNLIPVEQLKYITDTVYTGHDHNPRTLDMDGLTVHVVGSMQPYSFAEDADGRLYKTVTLQELDGLDTKDLCLRVVLKDGEQLPDNLDCLMLAAKRESVKVEEVGMGEDFNLKQLFDESMAKCGVGEQLQNELWERFNQT